MKKVMFPDLEYITFFSFSRMGLRRFVQMAETMRKE